MKLVGILLGLLLAARAAYADDGIATYAIVVGSNSGGPGQTDLRYAEDDARRVGKLLTELGGYQADQVDIVVHPSPDELRARIAKLGEKLAADEKAGRATRVLFYYSGHAKASAVNLGKDEMPLPELRQKLFDLPSKLTVVVLDACQSGAFSRVKGAAPAADFSFNSRQQLDATGVAVLASSSGSELSQESEQLKSSYFTHHLLVGLRGAGDPNGDGLVTVDEAYRYAYHQTLLATAETAVGGQHVSLEVDLKGHGEVPLSYPKAATAHIELPAALEGKTLIEDKRAQTV
ncbi:MAG TPA: caspase family protein, partial [Kofleriaceae bacterium]|nr:caspase family protein [Kofleriaceae bacterium]